MSQGNYPTPQTLFHPTAKLAWLAVAPPVQEDGYIVLRIPRMHPSDGDWIKLDINFCLIDEKNTLEFMFNVSSPDGVSAPGQKQVFSYSEKGIAIGEPLPLLHTVMFQVYRDGIYNIHCLLDGFPFFRLGVPIGYVPK